MGKILAILKIISFISVTLLIYSIFAVGLMLIKLFRLDYVSWRNFCLSIWAYLSMKCLAVTVKIRGTPPKPPFFLVSNHLSYLDIPVYYYALKTTFVAKSEIRQWPLIGWMAQTLGIIFIDRKRRRQIRKVNTIISNKINSYQGVVLFPEGRTSPGDKVLPFKPSLLQHPVQTKSDVHFAAIHYDTGKHDPPARETVCWWQDFNLMRHLFMLASNRSITATLFFGTKILKNEDRKILADELQKEIQIIYSQFKSSANSIEVEKEKVS